MYTMTCVFAVCVLCVNVKVTKNMSFKAKSQPEKNSMTVSIKVRIMVEKRNGEKTF